MLITVPAGHHLHDHVLVSGFTSVAQRLLSSASLMSYAFYQHLNTSVHIYF